MNLLQALEAFDFDFCDHALTSGFGGPSMRHTVPALTDFSNSGSPAPPPRGRDLPPQRSLLGKAHTVQADFSGAALPILAKVTHPGLYLPSPEERLPQQVVGR